jgi:hypothetical protein
MACYLDMLRQQRVLRTLSLNVFSIQFVGPDISSKPLDRNLIYKDVPLPLKHTASASVLYIIPYTQPFNFTNAWVCHQSRLFTP